MQASEPPSNSGSGDEPHDGSNGASNGSNGAGYHVPDPEPEPEPEPLGPPPPAVAELIAAAMRFVASKYKVALDGTPDTLSLIDQYVREAREAYKERPESIELVAPAVGAYLGEVMRQEFGGEWFAEGSHEMWRLYFYNVYLAFNPIGMAREAITMQDEPGWNSHFVIDPAEREAIDERLAIIPQVDEDEYFLPTTRLDVLTVVVETLGARAEASGTGDVKFTRDDYS
ncbi:MAG: hypothetical protein JWP97_5515 [Labilithrix sp.]|nr:hypothetical protein [Labilithrix sp.]